MVLQAIYRNSVLRPLVDASRLQHDLTLSIEFLDLIGHSSSVLARDKKILEYCGVQNGLLRLPGQVYEAKTFKCTVNQICL
jgi:hypothetical protein